MTAGPAPRIDRRALIRRAAAAGGIAWTAPVVLDSLTSPAAAVAPQPCTCTNPRILRRTWSEIKTPDYNDFDNKCAPFGQGSNVPSPMASCVPSCFEIPETCTDPLGGQFAFDKPMPSGSAFTIPLTSPSANERIIDGRLACTVASPVPGSVSTCTTGAVSSNGQTITFSQCAPGQKAFVCITWCG